MSSKVPVRRAQLIAPFGVGAMMTNQDGLSVMCASLDNWFDDADDIRDFKRREDWRLRRYLGLDHLREPPEYRERGEQNQRICIPAFRFPQWHKCPRCNRMKKKKLFSRGTVECEPCTNDKPGNWKQKMHQVRFVAVCEQGHIQDFPWKEWAHRGEDTGCTDSGLRLYESGGGSLSSVSIKCNQCGEKRSLYGITSANPDEDTTRLTEDLADEGRYTCKGKQPWTGETETTDCDRPLRGALRNATNIYFADTISSLYLPRGESRQVQKLIDVLEDPARTALRTLAKTVNNIENHLGDIRESLPPEFFDVSDEDLKSALQTVTGDQDEEEEEELEIEESESTAYRREEYRALQEPTDRSRLLIEKKDWSSYGDLIERSFSRVMLVKQLQETRALRGFSRLYPPSSDRIDESSGRQQLWSEEPGSWLPASVSQGEGIFLELDEEKVAEWEERTSSSSRVERLQENLDASRKFEETHVTPRLVLIHTLSHLLMNQLIFECGYSTAALRERLYVSDHSEAPMAGLLIYTAAGGSDGTLGGLVRMGKPGRLGPVLRRALEDARWCSSDPVCMEAGRQGGQGPDSLNLAACHSCALVPETSCEVFNRFLDRGVVVGGYREGEVEGYFQVEKEEATPQG